MKGDEPKARAWPKVSSTVARSGRTLGISSGRKLGHKLSRLKEEGPAVKIDDGAAPRGSTREPTLEGSQESTSMKGERPLGDGRQHREEKRKGEGRTGAGRWRVAQLRLREGGSASAG